ncbi:MAG: galactose mutarotase [Bacteroidia bacterium]|nr:galactose mutarotase [Bacteroidia bacterium]
MELIRDVFGNARRGEKIFIFTLRNDHGITIKITNYGGIVTSIETPDKNGKKANIALGFKSLEDYLTNTYIENCPYFGCIAGRYANRIAKGKFSIDGKEYSLPVNNGPNSLHGGITGFDKVIWVPNKIEKPDLIGVELKYRSVHMEEGYPGNLDLTLTYTLNHKNEFHIDYKATADRETIINLTNHTYFNLTGKKENILGHTLQLAAKTKTVNDSTLIPTGEIVEVAGTPYDFTTPATIGSHIGGLADGFDANFILNNPCKKLVKAGVLSEESTGRTVEVFTTEPGIQLYTGYYISEMVGKHGEKYGRYAGLALETQHYPDSPNHPDFPSTSLKAGDVFKSKTIYKFGTR